MMQGITVCLQFDNNEDFASQEEVDRKGEDPQMKLC